MLDRTRKLFRYTEWANAHVLETVRGQGVVDEKVLGLFGHVIAVQGVWLARLWPAYSCALPVWPEMRVEECAAELAASTEAWYGYLDTLDDAALGGVVRYASLSGAAQSTVLADILTHVVNHGTHHRGQIVSRLREVGHTPPAIDYVYFVREKG